MVKDVGLAGNCWENEAPSFFLYNVLFLSPYTYAQEMYW